MDYLKHITGRAYFTLNDGSKAVVRFLRDKKFDHYGHKHDMYVEQPKIPFFISLTWGKKRLWYERVHEQLKTKVFDHIVNEVLAKMHKQMRYKDKDKIPPVPLRSIPDQVI